MRTLALSILGIASSALLAGASFAQTSYPAKEDGQCRVTIDRSQSPGVFDVTRQSYDDGACICYAYTGPPTQPDAVEAQVANLTESKRCPSAKLMAVTGPGAAAAAGGSGFLAGPLAPLLGAGLIGGGAAAAASSGNATPVSP